MSWEIVTQTEVSELSGQPEEAFNDTWYDWVVGILKEETGLTYVDGVTTVTAEKHDGDGYDLLRVKHPPIVAVTSIAFNGTTVGSSRYKVYTQYIRMVSNLDDIIPSVFPVGVQNISVTYTSGYANEDIPDGMKLAVASAIIMLMQYNKRGTSRTNPKYDAPDRSDVTPSPTIPNQSLAATVRRIIRKGVRRKRLLFN